MNRFERCPGFTLIELLIVIAIILILIAVALPNFLEAQNRARLTTAEAEMRTLSVALESYRTDWPRYPPQSLFERASYCGFMRSNRCSLIQLTTPVRYLPEIRREIFAPSPPNPILDNTGVPYPWVGTMDVQEGHAHYYWSQESIKTDNRSCAELLRLAGVRYVLISLGPDHDADARRYTECLVMTGARTKNVPWIFSPTNGTKSNGDIQRYSP